MVFGSDRTRFYDFKRGVEDKNVGPLIKTIMTRCIHCTRCVRFAAEIAGVEALGTTGRGRETEIGTYLEKTFQSELSGNVIDLCPVGALTSKPYAFTSRPWEIRNSESIDLSDGVGSNIRLDFKETEILRVIPRLNESINEEWISDKTRFSYDSLRRQRIHTPYKKVNGQFEESDWSDVLELISSKLNQTSGDKISAVYGPDIDIEGLCSMNDLMSSLGSSNIGTERQIEFKKGFSSNYKFNATIEEIDNADACLIIGANPRFEASLVNVRLRKKYRAGDFEVGVIGAFTDLTYPVTHIGTNVDSLLDVCEGRHEFCSVLKQAKNPIIIVGTSLFERDDSVALENALNVLSTNLKTNISILHSQANQVSALELGIGEINLSSLNDSSIVFLLGSDNVEITNPNTFVVYMGHHSDNNAFNADIILPVTAFSEKVGTFYNLEGRPQSTKKALNSFGLSRDEWQIARAISEFIGKPLPYNSLEELQERLKTLLPSYSNLNNIEGSSLNLLECSNEVVYGTPLHTVIKDFYMTDTLSKSSQTMAKCSQTMRKNWQNFS
jgi:NADH-quinone oxidoreductase chain G